MALKRGLKYLIVMICVCMFSLRIDAKEVPNLDQLGSIHIAMTYEGEAVAGGSFTLYRVGDIVEENGNYKFQLRDEIANSLIDIDDIYSAELASQLDESEQLGEGVHQEVNENGEVYFTDVEPGLYLVRQDEAAKDYTPTNSFLIGVPNNEDGIYNYNIDASPKVELKKDTNGRPPVPDTPDKDKPGIPKLPNTGLLKWPIPILTICGLILLILGFALKGNDALHYEE